MISLGVSVEIGRDIVGDEFCRGGGENLDEIEGCVVGCEGIVRGVGVSGPLLIISSFRFFSFLASYYHSRFTNSVPFATPKSESRPSVEDRY